MVIIDSSVHSKSSKCKCVDELLNSSLQECKCVSLTELTGAFNHEILFVSKKEEHSELSTDNVENVNPYEFEQDTLFNSYKCDESILEKKLICYDPVMEQNHPNTEYRRKWDPFQYNKKDTLTVNYLYTTSTQSEEPSSSGLRGIQRNISNENSNSKNNIRLIGTDKPSHDLTDFVLKLNEKYEKPPSKKGANASDSIPRKLESSFITKEFKTTSFFDDYLENTPSDFTCADHQRQKNCRVNCKADNFEESIEDLYWRTKNSLNNIPNVCYMQPKSCSPSCQGIPYRKEGYGMFENNNLYPNYEDNYYFPEYTDFYRTNWAPHCKSPPMGTNYPQNVSSRQDSECCKCKTPTTQDNTKKNKPDPKKKKHFTFCKSNKVDQEELITKKKVQDSKTSPSPEMNVGPNFENISCKCMPPKSFNPYRDQYPSQMFPKQKIYSDSQFEYDWQCPFSPNPQEYRMKSPKSRPIMKSIGCGQKELENTVDVGKNITIQIMPNCCPTSKTCITHKNAHRKTKSEEKIVYSYGTCPLERNDGYVATNKYQEIDNQPCVGLYQGIDSREKTFPKWWNCGRKTKKYKSQCERNPNDEGSQMVATSNCQRVLPVDTNYINRNLKSFNQLKRDLKNLFATPCPSSSLTCPDISMQKVRATPIPLYAIPNPTPDTTNQCCQYEPACEESDKTNESFKDMLSECLKYLKKGLLSENQSEVAEEDCCCCQTDSTCCCQSDSACCCQTLSTCCCQNHNNCCCQNHSNCCCQNRNNCCCCQSTPKHFKPKKTIPRKMDVKKTKSCRCRSVEAKQSLKNCGTIVSNQCLRCVETVCTNTEALPKPLKKKRLCCKQKCCCCCNQRRNCCCNSYGLRESTTCCKGIEKPCNCQHFVYCCQCKTTPNLEFSDNKPEKTQETTLEKYIELLTSKIKNVVSKETLLPSSNDKISKCLKTNEKSTDTNSLVAQTPQSKDVFIKSITLDLCNLGEKQFSKFGVPSRQYPWSNNSFFTDMPNEIYRFIGVEEYCNNLLERSSDDPTPCLTPEIVHDEEQHSINKKQEVAKTEKSCLLKKEYISAICRALFDIKNKEYTTKSDFLLTVTDKENNKSDTRRHMEIINEEKDKKVQLSRDQDCLKSTTANEKDINNIKNTNDENCILQTDRISKIEPDSKSTSKLITKTSRTGVFPSISKKFSNTPRTLNTSKSTSRSDINYTPKPFTTRTGLMSFIPSFRESNKAPTPVKKIKNSPTEIKITKTKNDVKRNKLSIDQNKSQINESNATDMKTSKENEQVIKENVKELIEENSALKNSNFQKKTDIQKNKDSELKLVDQKNLINEPFNLKTFNNEIHDFYKKCFETPNLLTEEVTSFHHPIIFGNSRSNSSQESTNVNTFNEECTSIIPSKNKDEL